MSDEPAPRIKRLRLELGWTQKFMADHLGVTQASVSYMENGATESGPIKRLLDILEASTKEQAAE